MTSTPERQRKKIHVNVSPNHARKPARTLTVHFKPRPREIGDGWLVLQARPADLFDGLHAPPRRVMVAGLLDRPDDAVHIRVE